MSETPISTQGRPRDPRVDAAVRAAVLSLLTERGYRRMTVAAVAERARVGPGAVYRRWRSKGEMVFAAVVHGLELDQPPQSGSLDGDLGALGQRIALLSESEVARAAFVGIAGELDREPRLRMMLDDGVWEAERRYIAVILDRAVARGELRPGVDPELIRRLLVGAIAIAPIFGGGPTAARDATAIVAAGLRARYQPSPKHLSGSD